MDKNKSPEETPPVAGYEKTDAHIKPIFYFMAALSLVIVISLILSAWLFNYLETRETAEDKPVSPLADPFDLPPEPRLDKDPRGGLEQVLRETQGKLEGYAWIDEEAQVVRIPIERAIELTLEKGLPVRGAPSVSSNGGQ